MRPTPRKALSPRELALVESALAMYAQGWFPMHDGAAETPSASAANQDSELGPFGPLALGSLAIRGPAVRWVQPHLRGIIPLGAGAFRVSRSLRQRVRRGTFRITSDKAFARVVRECAAPAKGREETWLDPTIIGLFELLFRAGLAHSVEAWRDDRESGGGGDPTLVGGLYGLCVGSVFCGESMFSRPTLGGTDASKVCLVHLVEHLRARKFSMLDAQLTNPHLEQFGVHEMPRAAYAAHLEEASAARVTWGKFDPARAVERGAEGKARENKEKK